MSESKAVLELEETIAALKARLSVASQVYRDQRTRIVELEAALNKRGVKAVHIGPQEIYDDAVREMYIELNRLLNSVCNGCFLYRGDQANQLAALRDKVEQAITGEIKVDLLRMRFAILRALR